QRNGRPDNHETLVKIAGEVGLDTSETHVVLKSEAFSDQVRSEEAKAQSLQVRGVPYFVINDKYALSGAQPTDVFVRALKQVLDEEKQELKPLANEGEQGAACSDGSCEIPNES
ncbi:DsbA family protein, partial [Halalkalibacterium halodurans]